MVDIVQELHLGANTILAYFHYCCKGYYPFSTDWNVDDTASMADLDLDQIQFIKRTTQHVQASGNTRTMVYTGDFADIIPSPQISEHN